MSDDYYRRGFLVVVIFRSLLTTLEETIEKNRSVKDFFSKNIADVYILYEFRIDNTANTIGRSNCSLLVPIEF